MCRSKRFISAKDPVFSWYSSQSSEMSTTDWQFILPKVLKRNMPKNPKITAALKINCSFEYGCRKVRGNFKGVTRRRFFCQFLLVLILLDLSKLSTGSFYRKPINWHLISPKTLLHAPHNFELWMTLDFVGLKIN